MKRRGRREIVAGAEKANAKGAKEKREVREAAFSQRERGFVGSDGTR
jgi:hypothetical protein